MRNKTFNYEETVEEYVQNCEFKMECSCSSSRFNDKDHGHNKSLRKLFKKSVYYIDKKLINLKKTMSLFKEDI